MIPRIFAVAVCIGLALSLARRQRTGLALWSAGAAALLALLPL